MPFDCRLSPEGDRSDLYLLIALIIPHPKVVDMVFQNQTLVDLDQFEIIQICWICYGLQSCTVTTNLKKIGFNTSRSV